MYSDNTIDHPYQFQPATQLSARQYARLLILRGRIRDNAFMDDNERFLTSVNYRDDSVC